MKIKILDMKSYTVISNTNVDEINYKKWWNTLPEKFKKDRHLDINSPLDKILYIEEYEQFKNFEYTLLIDELLK